MKSGSKEWNAIQQALNISDTAVSPRRDTPIEDEAPPMMSCPIKAEAPPAISCGNPSRLWQAMAANKSAAMRLRIFLFLNDDN